MEKDSQYSPPDLKNCVAVVTGASRGAGKAIAMALGAAGATVYVTGRSTRSHPAQTYGQLLALSKLPAVPGSIDDTAEQVTRLGGRGIAVPCDHTREEDVAHLFARVQKEQGRLDLLVNNAWGGHETFDAVFDAPFWERGMEHWDSMFDRGVRNHLLSSRLAGARQGPAGHHHLLGPRPLHQGQPVLRPGQGRHDAPGLRHGRGAAPARHRLAGGVTGLDAH
jgi:NAD(P)-dependent dehydrogenase (short-subunit alcohol dehydrogenase family)